jgi:hypothetical protein
MQPPPEEKTQSRNAYYLRREVLWTGLLSSATSFGSNFAVRLGASNQLIGFMTAGQSLLAVLLTLPVARFLETRSKRLGWIVWGRGVQRMVFLLIALMPFIIPPPYQAAVFVGLILLRQIFLSPHRAGWSALFADVVPNDQRTDLLAQRRMLLSSVTIVATPLLGGLLDQILFPYGYQVAYAIGFAAGMMGVRDLLKLQEPKRPEQAEETPGPIKQRARLRLDRKAIRALFHENREFVQLTVTTLLFNLGAWLATSLYIIHYLRNLGASDSWVGTVRSIANLSMVLAAYFWQRVIPRWGDKRTLRIVAPLMGVFPLVVSFSGQLWPIMAAAAFNNWVMIGMQFSRFNLLLEATPADRRPTFLSLHTTMMNLAASFMPMIGVSLADRIGIPTVLLIAGLGRIAFGLLYTLWRAPKLTPPEQHGAV